MKLGSRISVGLFLAAVLLCSWVPPMDAPASQQVDAGLKRALVTYGTARTLHGLVSVLQGTQIDASPAGIGATFAPGQILAPAAEMLKQFSDVMLLVCVSFGIQKLLIAIGSFWVVSLALSAATLGWAALYFSKTPSPRWLSNTVIILLLVRFAIPLTVLGSDQLFNRFLLQEHQTSETALSSISNQAAKLAPPEATQAPAAPDAASPSMIDRLKDWVQQKSSATAARFEDLKNAVSNAAAHMVTLIAVYALQTIVLPLLLLLGLYGIAKAFLQAPMRRHVLAE